ncbi:hypothetical protein BCR32DRAFT_298617 [Anaeromyces robustus]|uniref:G-protein coupled receptors family 3 profile domain-containing protein n=1 Tax=Anaeromyces robustus TaxID=1754192 RepID=A0A1Y1V8P5_9FUNG|nr:hypothetical protein BCR32DRAFT_298617 [Anaeromyces robustus]|eukprot:ORX49381.1 hypothetical protein BCR32DRAFT_298617 [Anaeromyces robustus]
MSFSVLLENKYSDIMYSYMPGSSTFLGGAGIIITSDSQYHDELFEYIKVIIDDKYPYFSELNSAVTPFENIHGKDCLSNQTSKKMLCNSLLTSNGTYPYYYYNDKMKIIYLSHISVGSERGISFTTDSSFDYDSTLKLLLNKKFKCDDKADIKMNTITYYDESKIKIPINETNSLIVKQFDNNNNKHQTNNMICSIYDEALKNAKPYQFPYSTFSEISNFEFNAPVSVLLAHLYYNYYETDKNTFEDIVNECCDYMDYSLKPSCKNYDKKKYNITDCIENLNTRTITFLNCIPENNKIYKAECSYIPYKNEKGIILQICLISSLILNLIYLTIILIYRNEKCINMGGLQFLLGLIISSIILNISIFFWIGKQKKFKCILKFWTIIIGMTGFISSYSIKAQIIISLYNNLVKSTIIKKVNNNNYKSYILYIIFSIVQLFLLTFWTFTQKGVETKQKYLEDVGYYDYTYCSLGNETLLIIIFGFDYILLVLSIILAYRGRQIPSAYNESKKIFITSLISFLLLTLCYVSMVLTMKKDFIIFGIALFVIITSLIIVSVFVISKLLVIFNINIQSNVSVVVLNKDDNMDNIDRIPSLFLTR